MYPKFTLSVKQDDCFNSEMLFYTLNEKYFVSFLFLRFHSGSAVSGPPVHSPDDKSSLSRLSALLFSEQVDIHLAPNNEVLFGG